VGLTRKIRDGKNALTNFFMKAMTKLIVKFSAFVNPLRKQAIIAALYGKDT
jgi:hypothetical protein